MKYTLISSSVIFALLASACDQKINPPTPTQTTLTPQDAFCGNKRGGGTSAAHYDSSVANIGAFGQDYTTLFDQARGQWGGISSRVALNKTSYTTNDPDKYYVGNTSITGRLGITIPYDYVNGSLVEVGIDAYWIKANVSVYDNTFDANAFGNTERLATTIHELGHSLKLAHPGQGTCRVTPIPDGKTSVMVQGQKSYGVQQYDAAELKGVWGL